MFRWLKRNDGFEWRKHVRTTILLRREHRKRKLLDAKASVAAGLHQAGKSGVSASRSIVASAGAAIAATFRSVAAAGAAAWKWLMREAARVAHHVATYLPSVARLCSSRWAQLVCAFAAGAAALATVSRLATRGTDAGTLLLLAVTLAFLWLATSASLSPALLAPVRRSLASIGSFLDRLGVPAPRLALAAAVILAITGAGTLGYRHLASLGTLPHVALLGPPAVEGRAVPLAGDVFRIADSTYRLSGIEAPDPDQICRRSGNRRWRCGLAARDGLAQLVRGKIIRCTVSGKQDGHMLARCTIDGQDVAASLVRRGHVFAEGGLLARYASIEKEARAERAGLWSSDAERPSEFRAKRWNEAKRRAPNGCPIKGTIDRAGRQYVLPWSSRYSRVQVRTSRGERWFCTEQEAIAAGWKPREVRS